MTKRAIIIVLDSAGCGAMNDSCFYKDKGVNTLRHIIEKEENIKIPNLKKLGLYKLLDIESSGNYKYSFAKMEEKSKGKDTIIGHWEIAGIVTEKSFPTYPEGFPSDLIEKFEKKIGRRTLGNIPCSGTEIINKFGDEHIKTGFPIVYTSADSVFQVAAHEEIIHVKELYKICQIARELLINEHNVARVIARPFIGKSGKFIRTTNRRDFALSPPKDTLLNIIRNNKGKVTAIGKINDIFAGSGISEAFHIESNLDGIQKTFEAISIINKDIQLIFTNLVDFDTIYGHRRDIEGYAKALEEFDFYIPEFEKKLLPGDILFITADHGCDPAYLVHTDHTREYVPLFIAGSKVKQNNDLGILASFADLGKTIADYFMLKNNLDGTSFLDRIINRDFI